MVQNLCARDLMTKTDQVISLEMPVSELVQKLRAARVSGLPVINSKKEICGMVSIADVFKAVSVVREMNLRKPNWFSFFKSSPAILKVHDIYRKDFPVVSPETPVSELIDLVLAGDLYAIPVMNQDRREFYGVIGRHDITWAVFSD